MQKKEGLYVVTFTNYIYVKKKKYLQIIISLLRVWLDNFLLVKLPNFMDYSFSCANNSY
jgi:hypothetical protein